MKIAVALFVITLTNYSLCVNALHDINKAEDLLVNIPENAYKPTAEDNIDKRLIEKQCDAVVEDPEDMVKEDLLETAESASYVYRPLFEYRRIVHSKKRINMYNAFAGIFSIGVVDVAECSSKKMYLHLRLIWLTCGLLTIIMTSTAISIVDEFKGNINKIGSEKVVSRPFKMMKQLDNVLLKETTNNVTQNPQTQDTLYQISKDLVSAILSKLEIQDKITRITREALEAPGRNKGITAIETRRILDFISRTLSGYILTITRSSTEPELHRLVYGLAQIAAEVSIVSALKDITYATALSKKQSVDLSLRKKREVKVNTKKDTTHKPLVVPTEISLLVNKSLQAVQVKTTTPPKPQKRSFPDITIPNSPYAIISRNTKPVHTVNQIHSSHLPSKGFLNQTALDLENAERNQNNKTEPIVLEKAINGTHYVTVDSQTLDEQELNAPGLLDEFNDPGDNTYKTGFNFDIAADMEIDQTENFEDEVTSEKRAKQKMERLEMKAKKAILYAGDVAYLAAASVVAMRRALTASIEVHMSVKYAKNGLSNHQDLMMNLAKTAAQQAGKEAKSATSKSLACERVIKLALKYTAQSNGAALNHVANRVVMDSLSLATLAKSMAFVSSEIAINSLYQATDVKPPN